MRLDRGERGEAPESANNDVVARLARTLQRGASQSLSEFMLVNAGAASILLPNAWLRTAKIWEHAYTGETEEIKSSHD